MVSTRAGGTTRGRQGWTGVNFPWRERRKLYPHLSALPVFAGCDRGRIATLARWGDVIEVEAGEVLAREDRSNHWFFCVLAGSVRLSHRGRHLATLHKGSHFGEVAVLGFRPQAATATAVERTLLFVLSRRHFVSLAAADVQVQKALFPDVAPDGYRAAVRRLHDEGRKEWDRLGPHEDAVADGPAPVGTRPAAGRRISFAEAVEVLTSHDAPRTTGTTTGTTTGEASAAPSRLTTRARVVAAGASVAVATGFAFSYHPPLATLTPAAAVDVVGDISITGADVSRPTGRYLLTSVHVARLHLAATIFAWARGEHLEYVRTSQRMTRSDAALQDRDAFRESHRQAIASAGGIRGVDPGGWTVVIRDRGIGGPSAGLVYALAIVDMLDPADLANGRDIAATGELRSKGEVSDVGYIEMKVAAAHHAGAEIFVVPEMQQMAARSAHLSVLGADDLASAVESLRASARER